MIPPQQQLPSKKTTSTTTTTTSDGQRQLDTKTTTTPTKTTTRTTPITAAFFDYDKTLLATDSVGNEAYEIWDECWMGGRYGLYIQFWILMLIVIPLYDMGMIHPYTLNRIYISWIYTNMDMMVLQQKAVKLYRNKLRKKLYPDMIQKMVDHKKRGHLVFVVSASPEHILLPFFEDHKLIVDGIAATRVETCDENDNDDGDDHTLGLEKRSNSMNGSIPKRRRRRQRCTGRPIGEICIGPEKERVQHKFAERYGIDLSQSYAYSDHHNDYEFLQAVGHPIVVNPTKKLEVIAKKRDWLILRPSLYAAAGDE